MLISSESSPEKLELVLRTYSLRFGDEDSDDAVAMWERPNVDGPPPLIAPLYKIVIEKLA